MPKGDRTGPAGMGPMTGRAAGFCAGSAAPGYANPLGGRGMGGMGRGGRGGRGRRNQYYATGLTGWQRGTIDVSSMSSDQQLEAMRQYVENLSKVLDSIRKQINELEKDKSNAS